jgi:hypothetical protein
MSTVQVGEIAFAIMFAFCGVGCLIAWWRGAR